MAAVVWPGLREHQKLYKVKMNVAMAFFVGAAECCTTLRCVVRAKSDRMPLSGVSLVVQ